ncbi:replication initiator protein [Klebsiella pneumoniae]|nr:replication initiator protein [Klebsiella pneumoniae]RXK92031.1 replication initiator protein [Klebsiella pneumoniae]
MGSCAAPSAKGDDKFITTDYLQQCRTNWSAYVTRNTATYIQGFISHRAVPIQNGHISVC